MNQTAHYIAHLKIVEDNKLAMKEFDRRLPFDIEDLAMAAGLESTLPARSAILAAFAVWCAACTCTTFLKRNLVAFAVQNVSAVYPRIGICLRVATYHCSKFLLGGAEWLFPALLNERLPHPTVDYVHFFRLCQYAHGGVVYAWSRCSLH